jgi:WD40 repeat protein
VILWDLNRRRQRATLTGHTAEVSGVAFSRDGRMLASAGDDNAVILWDVARHRRQADLTGHTGDLADVAFSPDGNTLASASADRSILLWSVNVGALPERLCRIVNRDLTKAEWAYVLEGQSYRTTCG